MCGIAGYIARPGDPGAPPALERALRALAHRGPDDQGWLTFPDPPQRGPVVGLGNRRLSIIDLSPSGHQPMTTADGRFSIVYNGEIYNYRELRRELEAQGRGFRSQSDTEVLLEAWAAWGKGALTRVEGMFAFALLDRVGRRLVLARDGFGIKPLFYARPGGGWVFASEIRALFEFTGIGRQVNPGRAYDYLVAGNTDHGGDTMLAEVFQVPPAHCLDIALDDAPGGVVEPTRYWRTDSGERRQVSPRMAAEELRALFLDTVRLHLRSDVPIGFALSGGIDSAAVLAAARRLLGSGAELHAFGFMPDDSTISEESFQRTAAEAAGAILHPVRFEAARIGDDFDRLMDVQGEPFASPAIYAQHRIFALARETGITVVLGGQGADELFAGYHRYLSARAVSLLRQGRWLAAARFVTGAGGLPGVGRRSLARGSVMLALPRPLESALRRWGRRAVALDWVDEGWFRSRDIVPPEPWRPAGSEAMKELLVQTIESVHLQALMRYEDRNAMAFSIENRVPFLTARMAHFALALPEDHLIDRRGRRKAVLRDALRGIVPDRILDRQEKVGFAVPVATWLADLAPWVETRLSRLGECPVVREAAVRRYWLGVRFRRDPRSAFMLWRCLGLVTWAERMGVDWK